MVFASASSQRCVILGVLTLFATVIAAVAGVLATLFLHVVEHFFVELAHQHNPWVLPVAMCAAGLLAGFGWWVIRARPLPGLNTVIAQKSAEFPVLRTSVDAALQIFIVGAGASIGRETAPRQFAGVLVHRLGLLLRINPEDRTVLVAAGAGAALAAVYNTPLAGIAYTLCIMLTQRTVSAAVMASITSVGAVLLSRLVLGSAAYYVFPQTSVSVGEWLWVLAVILVAPLVGGVFKILCTRVKKTSVPRHFLPLTVALVLGVTGVSLWLSPDIAGNGVLVLKNGFAGNIGLGSFAALIVLKPLFTLLTLRSGAVGGVLTPALALGAAVGGTAGELLGQGALVPVFMAVGAAAVLAVSENSILFGSLFMVELIHAPLHLWFAVIVACAGAVYVHRQLGQHFFTE